MVEATWASGFMVIFLVVSAAGLWLQDHLNEQHKSKETAESARMIAAMLVTFSALVLGLLVTSVKDDFDDHTNLYRKYGVSLIELDRRLMEYGSQADQIRHLLRSFTASVFALTWPDEPRPQGATSPNWRR